MRIGTGKKRELDLTEESLDGMLTYHGITAGAAIGKMVDTLPELDPDGELPEFIDIHIVPMETAQADGPTDE